MRLFFVCGYKFIVKGRHKYMVLVDYKSIVLHECKYYVLTLIQVPFLQYIMDNICGARF